MIKLPVQSLHCCMGKNIQILTEMQLGVGEFVVEDHPVGMPWKSLSLFVEDFMNMLRMDMGIASVCILSELSLPLQP